MLEQRKAPQACHLPPHLIKPGPLFFLALLLALGCKSCVQKLQTEGCPPHLLRLEQRKAPQECNLRLPSSYLLIRFLMRLGAWVVSCAGKSLTSTYTSALLALGSSVL